MILVGDEAIVGVIAAAVMVAAGVLMIATAVVSVEKDSRENG